MRDRPRGTGQRELEAIEGRFVGHGLHLHICRGEAKGSRGDGLPRGLPPAHIGEPYMNRVRLLIFNAALGPLDYRVPEGMDVEPGSVVVAPLGPRQIVGIVWEADRLPASEVPEAKLRPLVDVLPVPPLKAELRRLIEWTADYYCASLASVARMVLASGGALRGPATMIEYRLTGGMPERMTPQRQAAIEALEGEQATIRELAGIAGRFGRRAARAGQPGRARTGRGRLRPALSARAVRISLCRNCRTTSGRQPRNFVEAVNKRSFAPFLLDGVTGSGKTEVYFEAIADALPKKRQVLVLLPEIALTETFLRRFEERFGVAPVVWHSSLKSTERRRAWRAIVSGEAQVVVGARSALFLPYAKLGLIVVDEAHEITFKQDDGVRYNARDVAVMRARFERIPIILSSATPALESLQMAESGVYRESTWPTASAAHSSRASTARPDRRRSPSVAAGSPRGWSRRCASGSSAASSRCCSSIAAATLR